jgi:hypothetical protein
MMSHGAQTFKQGDLTRALRAAEKAGYKVQGAEVRKDGSIRLDFGRRPTALQRDLDLNEWDELTK